MKYDLSLHPYFSEWQDPESGVISYILSERVAPVQQSFYFTNPGVSADGEWLWFYTAFPPSPCRSLGCVCLNPEKPDIYSFPNVSFSGNGYYGVSPMVSEEGDGAYYCSGKSVYLVRQDKEPHVICSLDDKFIGGRTIYRLATHLTKSKDERYFLLDGEIGNLWFLGIGDTTNGSVTILEEFTRNHNHAQFSPVNPEKYIIAQDWWFDRTTGKRFDIDNRIWIGDIDSKDFYPLSPDERYGHGSRACHEWWSADGLICWTDYEKGVFEYDLINGKSTSVWHKPLCHSHCNHNRSYYCADQNPYEWEKMTCSVLFYDRNRMRERAIVSALPNPPLSRSKYHIDPHPQFSTDGTIISYTTTVKGYVDVALASVAKIVEGI